MGRQSRRPLRTRGTPFALGVNLDYGNGLDSYRKFSLRYENWDGDDDVQLGLGFALPDGDHDGLPNDWENQNGLDPATPNLRTDKDGDRKTDYEEYCALTDPCDRTSLFELKDIRYLPQDGSVELDWSSVVGVNYDVCRYSGSMMSWAVVKGASGIEGMGGIQTFKHPNAMNLGDTGIYEVRVNPGR